MSMSPRLAKASLIDHGPLRALTNTFVGTQLGPGQAQQIGHRFAPITGVLYQDSFITPLILTSSLTRYKFN
jgi:hypothetical protein